jgi:very-short-patch-repair endonuclease
VIIDGVGEVDFVIGGRLILEADGRENHDGTDKRHKDLVRDAKAAALGYRTLRFDYDLIVHDWPVVEAAILAALSRA